MAEAPIIVLDRSRPFSTCHGERLPDDPHHRVHFWQGGRFGKNVVLLPFDSNGHLVPDDGRTESYEGKIVNDRNETVAIFYRPLYTAEMRAYLKAKQERLKMAKDAEPEAANEGVDDGEPQAAEDDVNLESYLRGQARYTPQKVKAAAKRRFGKNYTSLDELIVELVLDEKLIPEDELCAAFKRHLPKFESAA